MADSCRKKMQHTLDTGETTTLLTAVRLPETRKVLHRVVRFEKRTDKLFMFVEPELEYEKPVMPDFNTFRLDIEGCITRVIISSYHPHERLLGLQVLGCFPYLHEASVIYRLIKKTQKTGKKTTLRATFQLPGSHLQSVTCRIIPIDHPDSVIAIKEILDETIKYMACLL